MKRHKFNTINRRPVSSFSNLPTRAKITKVIIEPVKTETAKVYWGNGRRWITKKGAAHAEAYGILRNQCDCHFEGDGYNTQYFSDSCRYHAMTYEQKRKLTYRLSQRILKAWRVK